MLGFGGSPANPFPPCTARELLLKSVTLPRTALQLEMRWSTGLSLAKKASSGSVWRGPSGKLQVTLSVSPSGWQALQLDQALSEALPRNLSGSMSRIGAPRSPLSGVPSAVKKVSFPTRTACAKVPGDGGVPEGMSRAITLFESRFSAVTETFTSL